MEGTKEMRMAAVCLLTKMHEKKRDLQDRINRIREQQSAKDYKPEPGHHVDEWILNSWELEYELLDDSIDHLENQIIENEFHI